MWGGGGGGKAYSACVESTNRIIISSHHKINPENEHTRGNLNESTHNDII